MEVSVGQIGRSNGYAENPRDRSVDRISARHPRFENAARNDVLSMAGRLGKTAELGPLGDWTVESDRAIDGTN